jgi:hypothetical protein
MSSLRSIYDFGKETADEYIGNTNKTIIDKAETAKKTFWDVVFVFIFDWRVIFFTLLTITLAIAYGIKLIFDNLKLSKTFDEYGLNAINFFGHIFILNAFIAIFTISYYYYKRGHIGKKGPKGEMGPKGPQGKNQTCDICTLKTKTMKRDELDNDSNDVIVDTSLYDKLNQYKPKSWKSSDTKKTIGEANECKNCKNIKLANVPYVKGAIGNISENGILTSFQFLYEKEGKLKLLGGKSGLAGNKELRNDVQKVKCPKNCGIFRIETGYDNIKKGISGVKIYCRDIDTGEVKLPNKDSIGEIQTQHQTSMAFCTRSKSFIGGLETNANDNKMSQILVNKCNYKA